MCDTSGTWPGRLATLASENARTVENAAVPTQAYKLFSIDESAVSVLCNRLRTSAALARLCRATASERLALYLHNRLDEPSLRLAWSVSERPLQVGAPALLVRAARDVQPVTIEDVDPFSLRVTVKLKHGHEELVADTMLIGCAAHDETPAATPTGRREEDRYAQATSVRCAEDFLRPCPDGGFVLCGATMLHPADVRESVEVAGAPALDEWLYNASRVLFSFAGENVTCAEHQSLRATLYDTFPEMRQIIQTSFLQLPCRMRLEQVEVHRQTQTGGQSHTASTGGCRVVVSLQGAISYTITGYQSIVVGGPAKTQGRVLALQHPSGMYASIPSHAEAHPKGTHTGVPARDRTRAARLGTWAHCWYVTMDFASLGSL
ncbi:MAG: hypothetical protein ACO32I_07615 [Candidatus Limnocylindrus sp.]